METRSAGLLAWTRSYSDAPHTKLLMPALSPTMTEGNLAEWKKKEGDLVKPGEVLAMIETDKATLEWEATDEVYVAKILVAAGTPAVKVNTPVAILVESASQVSSFKDYKSSGAETAPAAPSSAPAAASPAAQVKLSAHDPVFDKVRIFPSARRLLVENGLHPSQVPRLSHPSAPLTKEEVLKFLESGAKPAPVQSSSQPSAAPAASPAPPTTPRVSQPQPAPVASQATKAAAPGTSGFVEVPHTQLRKIIAQHLTESKQRTPHAYLTIDCEIDLLNGLRKAVQESHGIKLSVNDFVIKAAAMSLKKVPAVNVALDTASSGPRQLPSIDISVAVASDRGLITPILKNADAKPLPALSTEMKELATRGKAGKLKPEEFQGGSISISNLGMYGIDFFSAIINPPQPCILAIGGASTQIRIGTPGAAEDLPPASLKDARQVTIMSVTLAHDVRLIDEDTAATFLRTFQTYISNPGLLFM